MKRAVFAFLLAFWAGYVHAGMLLTHVGAGSGGGVTYTGPLDAVPGAQAWYGLRGASAAYATGSNPAVQVQAGGGGTQYTINILSSGNLDISTALSDVGTTGSGSCTISGTTMSCASGTGTLTQYANITGAGLTLPAYITSASCSSFPCTMTLNASQSVAVAETITSYNSIAVYSWYDQSGANACGGSPCNIPGLSGRTNYIINQCQNGHPCVISEGSNTTYNPKTGMTSTNFPATFSFVGGRFGSFTTAQTAISLDNADSSPEARWRGAANSWAVAAGDAGNLLSATVSDSAVHAIQSVGATTGCVVNVDGTETSGGAGSCTPSTASTSIDIFSDVGLLAPMTSGSEFMEAGMWPSALSQANRTSLCGNQAAYWGTTVGTHC